MRVHLPHLSNLHPFFLACFSAFEFNSKVVNTSPLWYSCPPLKNCILFELIQNFLARNIQLKVAEHHFLDHRSMVAQKNVSSQQKYMHTWLKFAYVQMNVCLIESRSQTTSYQATSMVIFTAENILHVKHLFSHQWWNPWFHFRQSLCPLASCA